jgi:hypothetical protein
MNHTEISLLEPDEASGVNCNDLLVRSVFFTGDFVKVLHSYSLVPNRVESPYLVVISDTFSSLPLNLKHASSTSSMS